MPPITQFTSETTREKHWDNIVAIHSGLVTATSWSFDKRRMGDLKLVPEKFKEKNRKENRSTASSLNLTHCGNFVLIGYSSGEVERFNIQSGIHRASYGKPAHTSEVRGLWTDNLNQIVITGGVDSCIKFWNFKEETKRPIAQLKMPDSISMFRGHRESSMLCVIMEDFTAFIVDYDIKRIVRRFIGHTAAITDACFSPDSRWLITSSMDCTIRTWDIPSSYLVDQFKMSQPCVSITMSPTGDFLATAHVDFLGVYLWANKSLYEHISLRAVDPNSEPATMELPNMTSFEHKNDLVALMDLVKIEDEDEGELINSEYKSPEQIEDGLITMSSQAESKWKNILSLDLIKKRNKPKEPLKKPKQAPFFLPTVAGLDIQFDVDGVAQDDDGSKIIKTTTLTNLTSFGAALKKSDENGDFTNAIDYINNLGPSMIDYEIKSLSPLSGGSVGLMVKFYRMILDMFNRNTCFELAQAYLALSLKVHEELLTENQELIDILGEVEKVQNSSWETIESQLFYGIGVVSNLRNYC